MSGSHSSMNLVKKVGPKCVDKMVGRKKRTTKQWRARPVGDKQDVPAGSQAQVHTMPQGPKEQSAEWTTVGPSRRSKGKEVMVESSGSIITVGRVECKNGFNTLWILNDPLAAYEKIP